MNFTNLADDQEAMRSEEDTRKSKLTLKELNKLRKVREISRAEEIEHTKFVKVMYKAGGEEPAL